MTTRFAGAWHPNRLGLAGTLHMVGLLSAVLLFGTAPDAAAQAAKASAKPRIAVMEFTGVGVTDAEVAAVTDEVRNDLVKSGRFEVLERSKIQSVLNEQAFQQKAVRPDQAVQVGKLLNVQYIVTGRLVSPSPNAYQLTVEATDVETGQIKASETAHHEGPLLGFLDEIPAIASHAVAGIFGKQPEASTPPPAQPPPMAPSPAAQPAAPQPPKAVPRPVTSRFVVLPVGAIILDLQGPERRQPSKETISATAVGVGYERLFLEHLLGSAMLELGRVNQVTLDPGAGRGQASQSATGSINRLSLGLAYAGQFRSWLWHAGGGVYLANVDYRTADDLFSNGRVTSWTVHARGITVRGGADYLFPNRLFVGGQVGVDVLRRLSGSRIDAYNAHRGFDESKSNLIAIALRVGYDW